LQWICFKQIANGAAVELFRDVKVDWLGKKWYFLGFSLIFSVAGLLSILFWHHIPLGVDFKGGTLVYVKFDSAPDNAHIRKSLDAAGLHDVIIQSISSGAMNASTSNEVIISLPIRDTHESALDAGRRDIVNALTANYHDSGFEVRNVEIVGPQVGKQLTHQAELATLYSLAGMLVYLWFRFELIYGVAAVVAVFHDTLITIGAFSLTNKEITLTVIAAILTLIGYSMNDTIVVFDRIRENLRSMRREPLAEVVNRSINQTLSRTVLTSGLTFLTVLSLYLFGGEVLHGFSFALVVGILIGTYSSIAVAAPMLVAYQNWRASRGKAAVLPAGKRART
jgi:preprotein translocase subunit SecF